MPLAKPDKVVFTFPLGKPFNTKKMIRLFLISLTCVVLVACNSSEQPALPPVQINMPVLTGQELSERYCSSCHQYPSPQLLDKKSWEQHMLPRMGYLLGFYENDSVRSSLIEKGKGGEIVEKAGVFPKKPLIDSLSWQKIQDYYLSEAPEKPLAVPEKIIKKGLKQFRVQVPKHRLYPPSTTLVKITDDQSLYIGDAYSQSLQFFDKNLALTKSGKLDQGVVWIEETPQARWVTVMGSFSPTDAPLGMVAYLPKLAGDQPYVVLDSLQRPVHMAIADLNADGRDDLVVCEFGKWTGALSWFENKGNKKYQRHTLRAKPGATKVYVHDMNADGLPDVVALFAQGDEGVFIYYNKGNGAFQEKRVLDFSPSNGSSYFDLYDFNGDGHVDIIYTAGDNADFSPIFKHYHGLYIYLNDGKNQFTERFFYQLNGAYGATARDFDGDGDVDIALVSFFPDYNQHPEESFVYLENKGDFQFEPYTLDDPTLGRWIVMDAGDLDGDGDEDLVLGSLAFEVVPASDLYPAKWVKSGIPFIVLENVLNENSK